MKQYVGIVRDHSGSMGTLVTSAMVDYNAQITEIRKGSDQYGIDTIVSVVECGRGRTRGKEFQRDVVNSSVGRLQPLTHYAATGGTTPLWDSVADLLDILESAPDKDSPEVSFLLLIITDGQENDSVTRAYDLGLRIKQLQAKGNWTFTFRVPRGSEDVIWRQLSVPRENVMGWEQTQKGFTQATAATVTATQNYYRNVSKGIRGSSSFYADVAGISKTQLKKEADDITKEVKLFNIRKDGVEIRPFVEKETGSSYRPGAAFYELMKTEKVQPQKQIVLRDKTSGKFYGGEGVREMLGLPQYGDVRLKPGKQGNYDVFVQSTSVNRKLVAGTELVYWTGVRL